jgi:3-methyl-2-oxobutanoate hydroxymethyltransferase
MKISDFKKYKDENKKISMITAYDYTFAKILNETNIDSILVGDSLSMVMHGCSSTVMARTDMMAMHTKAVVRGAPSKFIISDMPFLSFRKGVYPAMKCVQRLMQAGANAIKLEGVKGHEKVIENIVNSDVPVMGHLGLTPQSINKFGSYKVQGKSSNDARKIIDDAKKLEELGCFAIVLECVPSELAAEITEILNIPTIGIGAGEKTSGQVLVLQDMLGMYKDISPKFVKKYLSGFELIKDAVSQFDLDIKSGEFPSEKESFFRNKRGENND